MAKKKKGGWRKKNRAIPLGPVLPSVLVAAQAYDAAGGITKDLPNSLMWRLTGYSTVTNDWQFDRVKAYWTGTALGFIAHKAANRFGINKALKKLTMGYLEI